MFTVLYVSMLLLAGAAGFLIGCFVGVWMFLLCERIG